MNPDEYCKNVAIKANSSFLTAFLPLNNLQKCALNAVYAFCRQVDDVVDNLSSVEIAQKKLAWWQEEIERLYCNTPQHPITLALSKYTDKFNLKREYFEGILEGMWLDLNHQGFANLASLQQYTYYVASCVGILAANIFGYTNEKTLEYATKFGESLQFINIIRDIGEDFRNDRIYIPQDLLAEYDFSFPSVNNATDADKTKLAQICESLYTHADKLYTEAFEILPVSDRKFQLPGIIMGKIYRTLLEEIKLSNFDVMDQKIILPKPRMIRIGLMTYCCEFRYKFYA